MAPDQDVNLKKSGLVLYQLLIRYKDISASCYSHITQFSTTMKKMATTWLTEMFLLVGFNPYRLLLIMQCFLSL